MAVFNHENMAGLCILVINQIKLLAALTIQKGDIDGFDLL